MFKLVPPDLPSKTINGDNNVSDRLQGYEEIQRDEWNNLTPGTYVRYENSGGKLVKGGFVINRSLVNNTLELRSELNNPHSATWIVPTKSIKRLWKKISDSSNNDGIARLIKSLHDRILVLENAESPVRDYSGELAQLKTGLDLLREDFKKLIIVVGELVEVNNSKNME